MPSDIIVAGLGKSAQEFAPVSQKYITIGVNDIDQFFPPTHLVVLDPPRRFTDKRREIICATGALTIWTTPEWPCFKTDQRRRKITTLRLDNKSSFDIDHKHRSRKNDRYNQHQYLERPGCVPFIRYGGLAPGLCLSRTFLVGVSKNKGDTS